MASNRAKGRELEREQKTERDLARLSHVYPLSGVGVSDNLICLLTLGN